MITDTQPGHPAVFGPRQAAALRLAKKDVLGDDGGTALAQFGGGYLDADISLPEPPPGLSREPHIDMFVCGADGSCQPTGSNPELIEAWTPAVTAFADAVYRATEAAGVTLAPQAYVTASFTPGTDVIGQAHFDDDQFLPEAGIGIVAIVGSDLGPRVAVGSVPVTDARPGLPMTVDQSVFDQFGTEPTTYQQAEAGRVVLFPQFGQLHAGPPLASTSPEATRRLMVLRAETVPAQEGSA